LPFRRRPTSLNFSAVEGDVGLTNAYWSEERLGGALEPSDYFVGLVVGRVAGVGSKKWERESVNPGLHGLPALGETSMWSFVDSGG